MGPTILSSVLSTCVVSWILSSRQGVGFNINFVQEATQPAKRFCSSYVSADNAFRRKQLLKTSRTAEVASRTNLVGQAARSSFTDELADANSIFSSQGSLLRALTGSTFSIVFGVVLLLAVLSNRLSTPELVDAQARTDILGVIAAGGLVTNGVYLLDLNVRRGEEVTLVGSFVQEYDPELSSRSRRDLHWLAESLLTVSPATSMLVYSGGKTLARVGVMGEVSKVQEAPILLKSLREAKDGTEVYLPALQVLPGKIEFTYLPENCQAVVLQPVRTGAALVIVGTNRARAFTPKDIAWMKGLCEQAAVSLAPTSYV